MKYLLWLTGCLSFAVGVVGLVVPLLPTTPFVLLAAACWARASPRFHRWLAGHRLFGPMVTSWERERAVPRRAKYWAVAMMAVSWLLSAGVLASRGQTVIVLLVTLVLAGMAVWLWCRPEPRSAPSHRPAQRTEPYQPDRTPTAQGETGSRIPAARFRSDRTGTPHQQSADNRSVAP